MRFGLTLLVIGLLSGCTAMVVAGGGASGGQDLRNSQRAAADSSITAIIERKHAANSATNGFKLRVETYNGTVTLSGTVDSYTVRDQAGRIAKETNGVTAVNNMIVVRN